MTSTSFITGTGFMKCMPITLSGRLVLAAMRPMGMDEVLEARMTCGGQTSSRVWKILNLMVSFSLAASTTKSAAAMSFKSTLVVMRARMLSFSAAASLPLSTLRCRFLAMFARPRSTNSCLISFMITARPLVAATWAMPLPI